MLLEVKQMIQGNKETDVGPHEELQQINTIEELRAFNTRLEDRNTFNETVSFSWLYQIVKAVIYAGL